MDRLRPWGLSLWRALPEFRVLAVLALVAAAIWGFAELADEVLEGETHALDQAVLLALRHPADPSDPLGPLWLEELVRDFTALGGYGVLVLLVLAAAVFLVLQRQLNAALFLVLAIGGGQLLTSLLKLGFDRPRPDLVPHGTLIQTASFPSGHAMMSAVTYLTLGAILVRAQPQRVLKVYLIALAILLTVIVGFSRVYLGVHWPTDVLAGWALGAAWALLCWLIAWWLRIHDRPPPAPGTAAAP